MQYSKERKEAVLKKMMPPHTRSIVELAREEGISEAPCTSGAGRRVYEEAKARHPERWSGNIRNWEPVADVWLNPPADANRQRTSARAA